ncbi:hypothetical protein [Phaeospirillum tilakii]|uniref:Uncharacterized protein n=1 Tax=Phaeospirillum tilakii TaxID=741673 RepID=A0ABW5C9A3_9PROT
MGLFGGGGGGSAPAVATTVATKAASYADDAVQDAYESTRRRNAAAGTGATILTGGLGDSGKVGTATSSKTLLGQ